MARRRKYIEETSDNTQRWLISYADFITLLFAFFVVMYSISTVNEGKYRVLSDSISSAFDPAQDGIPIQLESPLKPPIFEYDIIIKRQQQLLLNNRYPNNSAGMLSKERTKQALNEIAVRVENSLSLLIDNDLVNVKRKDLWIEVEIKSSVLFPSGSSQLSDESRPVLNKLSQVLAKYENQIQVEGFTDNFPINTKIFPSNWELSASRAASVVHLLSKEGINPRRLSAVGFGEFRPVATNGTEAGRSKNRRINIIILSSLLNKDTASIK